MPDEGLGRASGPVRVEGAGRESNPGKPCTPRRQSGGVFKDRRGFGQRFPVASTSSATAPQGAGGTRTHTCFRTTDACTPVRQSVGSLRKKAQRGFAERSALLPYDRPHQ